MTTTAHAAIADGIHCALREIHAGHFAAGLNIVADLRRTHGDLPVAAVLVALDVRPIDFMGGNHA